MRGKPGASSGSAPQNAALTTTRRVALGSPQRAVRSYIEGIKAVNGGAICNALDDTLQQSIVRSLVRSRAVPAGASCMQALGALARAATSPSERHSKLPRLHVTRTGDRAVVRYVGTLSHKRRAFVLVRHGSGWLIDTINGRG